MVRGSGIIMALLILAVSVLSATPVQADSTHSYVAGANASVRGTSPPETIVCPTPCPAPVPPAVCCVGGFFFTLTSPTTTLVPADLVWGSDTGLTVCLFDASGDACGPGRTTGDHCGPLPLIVFGEVPVQAVVVVHTLLVEPSLHVCGATKGTVTVLDG